MASIHMSLARAMTEGSSFKFIIAISTAAGGLILIIIVVLLIFLYCAISKHRRLLADLEQCRINIRGPNLSEASADPVRPLSALRRSSFVPFGVPAGWSTLDSQESILTEFPIRPIQANDAKIQKRQASSGRISWPFSRSKRAENIVPLSEVRAPHPSAIAEGPQALDLGAACDSATEHHMEDQTASTSKDQKETKGEGNENEPISEFEEEFRSPPCGRVDAAASSDSLTPNPLFSSRELCEGAIKVSKTRYRAKKVGAARLGPPDSIISGSQSSRSRWHSRSLSLGCQNPGSAPKGPVPPLPPSFEVKQEVSRPRSWIQERSASLLSGSSLESVGSSLLIASPKVTRFHSARLKEGPKHDWSNSLVAGPMPLPRNASLRKPTVSPGSTHKSLRFSAADYNCASEGRCASLNDRLSVVQLNAAETVRLGRISADSPRPARVLRTPRRSSRLSVASNGSPNSRLRASVLRDVSSGQSIPSRQTSQTSTRASSTRSSNGNPFHWDPSPMQSGKPSALKGSPGSRKGHRRQNCVRILLSPTIISSHRPSPSSSMADIKEESPEPGSQVEWPATRLGFSNTRALPRPPSSSTFEPEVKLHPTILHASLTPDSPTLSLMSYTQEPSSREFSNGNWSFTASPSKLHRRGGSNGSILTIPTFSNPGKAINTINSPIVPTPTFSFSRPSNEFDEECNAPPEFRLLAQPTTPSSSSSPEKPELTNPVASSTQSESDSVLLQLHPDQLEQSREPLQTVQNEEPVRSNTSEPLPKWPLASTIARQSNAECSLDSPPCSPKSQPNLANIAKNKDPPATLSADPVEALNCTTDPEARAIARTEITETDETGDQVSLITPTAKRSATLAHTSFGSHEVPSSPLRCSIAQLRRMNSDASRDSLEARRYLKLGREASMPGLEVDALLAGGKCKWDSWVDIPEVPSEEDMERNYYASEVDGMSESGQDEEVYGEMQRREDLEVAGVNVEMDERVKNDLGLEVVEDGEDCRKGAGKVATQEAIDFRLPMANSSGNRDRIEHPRITQLRGGAWEDQKMSNKREETPVVEGQPSSSCASPGSLYDENGFLKC